MITDPLGYDQYLFQKRDGNPGPKLPVVAAPNFGWSVFGELISHDSRLSQEPPKVIQLQCSFDRQMQTHTIQFNGPDNFAIGAIGAVMPEAEIIWSVEGVSIRRVVSISDGLSISGEAQSVTVNMYDQSFDGPERYTVGCTVAPGVRGDTQQPPLLRVNTTVAGGVQFPFGVGLAAAASADWLLPPNVGAVSSFMTVRGAAPPAAPLVENEVEITHFNGGLVPVKFYGLSGCFKYIPLFGGTRLVRITNRSATAIAVAHHFGIEG